MFGFTPDTELRNDMRALVGSLLEGNSFPGKVPLAAALHHFASSCGLGYLASVVFFRPYGDLCAYVVWQPSSRLAFSLSVRRVSDSFQSST